MKITEKQFTDEILPKLRAKAKNAKELHAKALAYLDDMEIVDEDGNPVDVELVSLSRAVASDEQDERAADDEHDEEKAKDDEEDEKAISERIEKAVKAAMESLGSRNKAAPRPRGSGPDRGTDMTIPANVKRYGSLRSFTREVRGVDADVRAYRFGMWCLAGMGHAGAKAYCEKNGLKLRGLKAHVTNVNADGGFLVPDEFGTDLIDLREQFGVFRKNAKIVPMASDTRTDPRVVGGLQAEFVGENETVDAQKKIWDNVTLTARKVMIKTRYTNELNEDAVLNIGDDLAYEISYAFALKEDQCGFIGDGSATYGGIVGVFNKILGLDATPGNIAGVVQGTGSGWAGLTLADFNNVIGRLPEYADGSAKWYVSKAFWATVMQKLAYAAGGNATGDITSGTARSFLGAPVEVSQVLPRFSETNAPVAIYGDLRMGASFGDRRADTIMFSEHESEAFNNDAIAVRGTERFDINVHSVGNASATASEREAGPLVILRTGS